MPRGARDEIEVVFGFKQVFGLALVAAVVLAGVFFWGFETGHKRAARGEPSLLAFLEKSADRYDGPVAIPDVLLEPLETLSDSREGPAAVQPSPAASPSETPKPRVKPNPRVKTKARVPSNPDVSGPAPAKRSPSNRTARQQDSPQAIRAQVPAAARLHYQVAALSVSKNAKALVDWLRNEGFPAGIRPISGDGLHRVFVGPFRDLEAAESAKDRLRRDGFTPMVRRF